MPFTQHWPMFRKIAAAAFTIASALGLAVTFGVRPSDIGHLLWPWGALVGLGITTIMLAIQRRQPSPTPESAAHRENDQRLLDAIFMVLPRNVMRLMSQHGFQSAWPGIIVDAPLSFVESFGEVEHQFMDPRLEEARALLYACADTFVDESASRIFPTHDGRGFYNTGYAAWEIEDQPELQALMRTRQDVLTSLARKLVAAYDEFVRVARHRGFRVDAIDSELHPRPRSAKDIASTDAP
jgi:hypothetical protein